MDELRLRLADIPKWEELQLLVYSSRFINLTRYNVIEYPLKKDARSCEWLARDCSFSAINGLPSTESFLKSFAYYKMVGDEKSLLKTMDDYYEQVGFSIGYCLKAIIYAISAIIQGCSSTASLKYKESVCVGVYTHGYCNAFEVAVGGRPKYEDVERAVCLNQCWNIVNNDLRVLNEILREHLVAKADIVGKYYSMLHDIKSGWIS